MSPVAVGARDEQIDEIAEALPLRASMLSRLFIAHASVRASRTETGVLQALSVGPCRITELAAREGVTQPAITLLVNRLAARGLVRRECEPADRRVVLVSLTGRGRDVWNRLRAEYRALVHEEMAALDDDDVEVLARAVGILDGLIAGLRRTRVSAPRDPSASRAEEEV
jgi:DNA-binding MarR family transcriptional regulator